MKVTFYFIFGKKETYTFYFKEAFVNKTKGGGAKHMKVTYKNDQFIRWVPNLIPT